VSKWVERKDHLGLLKRLLGVWCCLIPALPVRTSLPDCSQFRTWLDDSSKMHTVYTLKTTNMALNRDRSYLSQGKPDICCDDVILPRPVSGEAYNGITLSIMVSNRIKHAGMYQGDRPHNAKPSKSPYSVWRCIVRIIYNIRAWDDTRFRLYPPDATVVTISPFHSSSCIQFTNRLEKWVFWMIYWPFCSRNIWSK